MVAALPTAAAFTVDSFYLKMIQLLAEIAQFYQERSFSVKISRLMTELTKIAMLFFQLAQKTLSPFKIRTN